VINNALLIIHTINLYTVFIWLVCVHVGGSFLVCVPGCYV